MDKLVSITWWRTVFVRYGQALAIVMTIAMVVGFGWNQFGGSRNGGASGAATPDKVIVKVNGEPVTQAEYLQYAAQARNAKPGSEFAAAQGKALSDAIQAAIVRELAKKHGVHPTAAEVDQTIDQLRDSRGQKKASDSDWENYVQQNMGTTLSELRDRVANDPGLLINALQQSYKSDQKVTDADVNNQNQEVKFDVVLIPFGTSPFMPAPRGKAPMTEAQARQKAEDLLAKAKSGADIAAIARANSSDPSAAKGGEIDFRPEYKGADGMGGALSYGKEFDEAIHKTAVGQFTPIVKSAGFSQGFIFAKVLERKANVPKDFNPKKSLDDLKTAKAHEKLGDDFQAAVKNAKLEWQDPDRKVYYDQNKLQEIPMEIMQAQMSGKTEGMPTQADMAKQQELVDNEWEAMLKRHPDDDTAALMVAEGIKSRKRFARGTTAAQNDQYRDQLIKLYTDVLKRNEDRDIRFSLADLLAEKKDNAKAAEQYNLIAKFMAQDPPYNLQSMQSYQTYYQRLATDFNRVGQPDQAAKMQKEADDLKPKIAAQQAIEQAQRQAQMKTNAQPGAITIPPSGKTTTTTTPPSTGQPGAATQPGTKR
jgi:tetratricopeptide (TPR) repeat protein